MIGDSLHWPDGVIECAFVGENVSRTNLFIWREFRQKNYMDPFITFLFVQIADLKITNLINNFLFVGT
jgi:hypothetical protein